MMRFQAIFPTIRFTTVFTYLSKSGGGERRSLESGFTLIELVVTIVILGTLSAVAIPRFVNLGNDARVSALNAAMGATQTAASIANMKCLMKSGCYIANADAGARLPIGPNGEVGVMHWGFPTGASRLPTYFGLKDWMTVQQGMTLVEVGGSRAEIRVTNAPDPTNCKVLYIEASGYGARPSITVVQSGC